MAMISYRQEFAGLRLSKRAMYSILWTKSCLEKWRWYVRNTKPILTSVCVCNRNSSVYTQLLLLEAIWNFCSSRMTAQKFGGGAVVKKKIRKSKNGLRAAASSSSSLCSFEESIENLKVGLKYKSQNWFLMGEQFKMMHCFMSHRHSQRCNHFHS